MGVIDTTKLPYEIKYWVVGYFESDIECLGAIISPYNQTVTLESQKNHFFWHECLPCPRRLDFSCNGATNKNRYYSADCPVYFPNKHWDDHRVGKFINITHPPTLLFLTREYKYNYAFLPENMQGDTIKNLRVVPYCLFNVDTHERDHYSPGYLCMGSLTDNINELYFQEYERGEGNTDLSIKGDVIEIAISEDPSLPSDTSLESWVKNFNKYLPYLVNLGEDFTVGSILENLNGPGTRFADLSWSLIPRDVCPKVNKLTRTRFELMTSDETVFVDFNNPLYTGD